MKQRRSQDTVDEDQRKRTRVSAAPPGGRQTQHRLKGEKLLGVRVEKGGGNSALLLQPYKSRFFTRSSTRRTCIVGRNPIGR